MGPNCSDITCWRKTSRNQTKEKPRPISRSESSQTTITGVEAIAPALSLGERELHRHAGHDAEDIDSTEPLGPVINDYQKWNHLHSLLIPIF